MCSRVCLLARSLFISQRQFFVPCAQLPSHSQTQQKFIFIEKYVYKNVSREKEELSRDPCVVVK